MNNFFEPSDEFVTLVVDLLNRMFPLSRHESREFARYLSHPRWRNRLISNVMKSAKKLGRRIFERIAFEGPNAEHSWNRLSPVFIALIFCTDLRWIAHRRDRRGRRDINPLRNFNQGGSGSLSP